MKMKEKLKRIEINPLLPLRRELKDCKYRHLVLFFSTTYILQMLQVVYLLLWGTKVFPVATQPPLNYKPVT